jgi:hypothetical protein
VLVPERRHYVRDYCMMLHILIPSIGLNNYVKFQRNCCFIGFYTFFKDNVCISLRLTQGSKDRCSLFVFLIYTLMAFLKSVYVFNTDV